MIVFTKAYLLADIARSKWYGCVIRGIPRNYTHETLTQFLYMSEKNLSYCTPPSDVGNARCSIAVLNDRDAAERLCSNLNNTIMEEFYKIKV